MLTGADTEKVRKFGHHELSTYGIGKDNTRQEWGAIGRELIRLGLAKQDSQRFNVLELTAEGRAVLTQRKPVQLTKPMKVPERREHAVGEIACDETLFEKLRALRKRLADERGVPPYIVFSDVSLRQIARVYPASSGEFARISGVGQRKLAEFGDTFLREVADYLATYPRQIFADDSFTAAPAAGPLRRGAMNDTTRESLKRFRAGESVPEIASRRGFVVGTIYGHLANAFEAGEAIDLGQIISESEQESIRAAFAKHGGGNLVGVSEALGSRYDMGLLRLCRTVQQRHRS